MPRSGLRPCLSISNSTVTRDAWQDNEFAAEWDEAGNLLTNPDRPRQLSLLVDLLASNDVKHLLDLGIGSAQVETELKRRHPDFFNGCHITGVDASAAMLELAKQRCEERKLGSIELLQADFGSLDNINLVEPPDAVICVQALHEVTHAVKQSVFGWVHERLPAGRPFFILDRFEYPHNAWLGDWRATWNWMRSNVSADVKEFEDYHRLYSAKTDHIATLEAYRGWLENAGFETICPYYCFNRALIIARA